MSLGPYAPPDQLGTPACWHWPYPAPELTRPEAMLRFHLGRCAVCGRNGRTRTRPDCTADTNVLRGYLCADCLTDVLSPAVLFRAYRSRPPAWLLDLRIICG